MASAPECPSWQEGARGGCAEVAIPVHPVGRQAAGRPAALSWSAGTSGKSGTQRYQLNSEGGAPCQRRRRLQRLQSCKRTFPETIYVVEELDSDDSSYLDAAYSINALASATERLVGVYDLKEVVKVRTKVVVDGR